MKLSACDAGRAIGVCGFASASSVLVLPQWLPFPVQSKGAAVLPEKAVTPVIPGPRRRPKNSGLLVRLRGPVDTAGGVFGAPAFEVKWDLGSVRACALAPSRSEAKLEHELDLAHGIRSRRDSTEGPRGRRTRAVSPA